jgi:hypothetical protein
VVVEQMKESKRRVPFYIPSWGIMMNKSERLAKAMPSLMLKNQLHSSTRRRIDVDQ